MIPLRWRTWRWPDLLVFQLIRLSMSTLSIWHIASVGFILLKLTHFGGVWKPLLMISIVHRLIALLTYNSHVSLVLNNFCFVFDVCRNRLIRLIHIVWLAVWFRENYQLLAWTLIFKMMFILILDFSCLLIVCLTLFMLLIIKLLFHLWLYIQE